MTAIPERAAAARHDEWPEVPLAAWEPTRATLHMWTQMVGKVRLALAPMLNHWWQVALYVTPRGLTTSPMPCGDRYLQIDLDLRSHLLRIQDSGGGERVMHLEPRSVADFYAELIGRLRELGAEVQISTRPVEVVEAIPFDQDHEHAVYDASAVERFFAALRQADRLMHRFRSGFLGKASPVHFFWGSFDHAVTRFSGRAAPPHPGGFPNLGDWIAREAYSHEVTSCGFWPGDARFPEAAFYAYAYPIPEGLEAVRARPEPAFWHGEMREFVLPYATVRRSPDPDADVLAFFESAHAAAADLAGWDRARLERDAERPERVREAAVAPGPAETG